LDTSAAETENDRDLAGLASDGSRAAARTPRYRRSALGGPLDARVPQSPLRPGARGSDARSAHLPPGVYSAMGNAFASHPDHVAPFSAQTVWGDGGKGHERKGIAGGGGAADRGQDRWSAIVCRRVNQNGAGVGIVTGSRRAL